MDKCKSNLKTKLLYYNLKYIIVEINIKSNPIFIFVSLLNQRYVLLPIRFK